MSITANRRANRKLAEAHERQGRVPFIEEARSGLLQDPRAWAQSGFRLVTAAIMIAEPSRKGTEAYMALLSGTADCSVSAELVAARNEADLWPVAQMLFGMGFECLLKCLLAHQGALSRLKAGKDITS